jgi:hypothetical protein
MASDFLTTVHCNEKVGITRVSGRDGYKGMLEKGYRSILQ